MITLARAQTLFPLKLLQDTAALAGLRISAWLHTWDYTLCDVLRWKYPPTEAESDRALEKSRVMQATEEDRKMDHTASSLRLFQHPKAERDTIYANCLFVSRFALQRAQNRDALCIYNPGGTQLLSASSEALVTLHGLPGRDGEVHDGPEATGDLCPHKEPYGIPPQQR